MDREAHLSRLTRRRRCAPKRGRDVAALEVAGTLVVMPASGARTLSRRAGEFAALVGAKPSRSCSLGANRAAWRCLRHCAERAGCWSSRRHDLRLGASRSHPCGGGRGPRMGLANSETGVASLPPGAGATAGCPLRGSTMRSAVSRLPRHVGRILRLFLVGADLAVLSRQDSAAEGRRRGSSSGDGFAWPRCRRAGGQELGRRIGHRERPQASRVSGPRRARRGALIATTEIWNGGLPNLEIF